MRALVQRVGGASVVVDGEMVSSIGRGLLVFLGVMRGDAAKDIDYMARKAANLRVFEDEEGRMNLSVRDVAGGVLVVSQFTLAADTKEGNRPSFVEAEDPERAEAVYIEFMEKLRAEGVANVQGGRFAAHMRVSLVNDGPVTIMLDSKG